MHPKIALIGDYSPEVTAHVAIPQAIKIANEGMGSNVTFEWINTDTLLDVPEQLEGFSAVWAVPASPYRNMQGTIDAIRFARETQRPFLGTCGGYQHAILEYARNALGLSEADNSEVNPETSFPLINPLSCALIEQDDQIRISKDTKAYELYQTELITEQYRCSYGFNQSYAYLFKDSDLVISAYDLANEPKMMELNHHPFFIGTGFQPERSALRGSHHPIVTAFIQATLNHSK